MRRAERALDGGARVGRKHVPVRGLEVVDQDLVREEVGRVDEAGLKEAVQEVAGAGHERGVREVVRREGRGAGAQGDSLRHDRGSQALVVHLVRAAQRLRQSGRQGLEIVYDGGQAWDQEGREFEQRFLHRVGWQFADRKEGVFGERCILEGS